MKLNQYHKRVLGVALDIFEECGDDSFLDVRDNFNLYNAFNELKLAAITNVKIQKATLNKKTVKACLKKLGS